jgi:hypothetical protein
VSEPIPTDLDQAVIDAGLALIRLELARHRDEQAITDADAAYKAALAARWPDVV